MASIVLIGHPVLRTPARRVSLAWIKRPSTRALLLRMFRIMYRAEGVGLAANQIGLSHRLFVMDSMASSRYPGRRNVPAQVWFNPRILARSKKQVWDWEGCLSIPGYRGLTPRADSVVFEAQDAVGRRIRRKAGGFEARILQHETDHLDGLVYMDRFPDLSQWTHLDEFNRQTGSRIKDRR